MLFDPAQLLEAAYLARRDARRGPATIRARQMRRLQDMVDHARTWSPAYADVYADLPARLRDVSELPVVTKPDLMGRFDEWVTDRAVTLAGASNFTSDVSRLGELYLGRYFACTTSGVTGRRAILLKDRHELGALGGLRAARLLGTLIQAGAAWPFGRRIAAVVATGGHFAGAAGVELARRSASFLEDSLRTFSVLASPRDLVRELNAYQPAILMGYPTAIRLLADEARAGHLRIRPAYTITAGETLSVSDRDIIRSAFGGLVQQMYAASEALGIAFECHAGELHINEDWYIVEPVDDHHRPVAPGRASHTTLLTNLSNRVQPILRYDLGDSVTLTGDPCPCGSPLAVLRVEGRRDDILEVSGGVRLLPLAIGTVIEETPGVARFQVIQSASDRLRIRIEPAMGAPESDVWRAVEVRLRPWLASQGASEIELERDPARPMRDQRTGKFRQVWREKRYDAGLAEATTR